MSDPTHVTWSREASDRCPDCGTEPVLIVADAEWNVDGVREYVCPREEVTAHYCLTCGKITSLSLNT